MKQFRVFTFLFFMIGIAAPTNAQFWKKLKKKVQQKVENKIEKETDKVVDSALYGKKKEKKIKQSSQLPKMISGSGVLKLNNFGFEYVTKDIGVSVYGKFTKTNLSNSVKTYNQDRLIKPVDAFPEGYALAFNGGGFLNPQQGQIIIHHADSTKVVFSIKGTWNTINGDKPVSGSYINLEVKEIIDKRYAVEPNNNDTNKTTTSTSNTNNTNTTINNSNTISSNNNITIPNSFSFSSSLEVKMTSSKGGTADLEFLLGNYSNIYAMAIASKEMGAGGKVYNVVTPKSITMFVSVAGMKMKKTVPQQQFSQASFSDKVPTNPDDLKKTGATKTILGFTCYEYKYINDGGYVSIWATKDFPANGTKITMLGMRQDGPIDGFVLEIDMKSKNETANMKAVKFNRNKNVTINTKEYKSMGF
ncbi:MAG: DUF4412 domain-containing protein [Flavobacteriaceae bacterium]